MFGNMMYDGIIEVGVDVDGVGVGGGVWITIGKVSAFKVDLVVFHTHFLLFSVIEFLWNGNKAITY